MKHWWLLVLLVLLIILFLAFDLGRFLQPGNAQERP